MSVERVREEHISVCVRMRPLLRREKSSTPQSSLQFQRPIWEVDEGGRTIRASAGTAKGKSSYAGQAKDVEFVFDHVFPPDTSNQQVFEVVAENVIWSTMEGFNGTIFAYGQTNSGKTYTMKGSSKNPGMIPLAIQDVFSYIKQTPEREFLLRVSYLEIYNEVINDLLCPSNTNVKVHETAKGGVFIGDLKEEIVLSPQQVMSIIAAGEAHRHVGSTDFNEMSSRSHTIFRMVIESKPVQGNEPRGGASPVRQPPVRVSTLHLIDLAGSEKAGPTTTQGVRRTEGAYINKSLLTLGNVISKLSKGSGGHIPYRDSKLTRILQPSLSGNARIAIVCTISPTTGCFEESHNTLKFADRAKAITNRAKLNEVLDDKALIKIYRDKISQLKRRLQEVREKEEQIQKLQTAELEKKSLEESNVILLERLREQEQVKMKLEEKINRLTRLILVSTSIPTPMAPHRTQPPSFRGGAAPPSAASPSSAGIMWRSGIRSPAFRLGTSAAAGMSPVRSVLEPPSPRNRVHSTRRSLDFLNFGANEEAGQSSETSEDSESLSDDEGEEEGDYDANGNNGENDDNDNNKEKASERDGNGNGHAVDNNHGELPANGDGEEKFRVFTGRGEHKSVETRYKRLKGRYAAQAKQLAAIQATVDELRDELNGRDERIRYMNINVDVQTQQVKDLQQQLATKDQQMSTMQAKIKDGEDRMRRLLQVTANEDNKNVDFQVLSGIVSDYHAQQLRGLKEQLLDEQIMREVHKADNYHLLHSVDEKESLIREWAEFFEYFEQKQHHLEEELQRLRSRRKGYSLMPKYYSDGDAND